MMGLNRLHATGYAWGAMGFFLALGGADQVALCFLLAMFVSLALANHADLLRGK